MTKTINKGLLYISVILIVLFLVHYFVAVNYNTHAFDILLLTYGFNLGVTFLLMIIFKIIVKGKQKQVGSGFLLTSMIKFLLFFIVIYPFIKVSGGLKSFAFAAFFIPYAVCLVMEVLITIRLLGHLDAEN